MAVKCVVLGDKQMEGVKERKEGQRGSVNESCNAGGETIMVF